MNDPLALFCVVLHQIRVMKLLFSLLIIVFLLSACNQNHPILTDEESVRLELFKTSVTDQLEDINPDSSMALARAVVGMRDKISDSSTIVNALRQIGVTFENQQQFDSSLIYYQQAYDFLKEGGSRSQIALTLTYIGKAHILLKDNDKAAY